MAKKKQEAKKGLDEWMATYSDMVTLLLCFFVLLYNASTPNETKFQYIFQSFNSQGKYINPFVMEDIGDTTDSVTDEEGNSDAPANAGEGTQENPNEDGIGLPNNYDELFVWATMTAASSNYSDAIQVSQSSSNRITIRFNNSIMFEGDSAVLLPSGRAALREFMPGLKAIRDYIKNIRVQGHTAEGLSAVNDWDLSAARACSVVKYMDFQVIMESEKYIPEGRACYDPIADNSTPEGRQQNRRVELVIIRNDAKVSDTAILQDILMYDYGILHSESTQIDRLEATGGVSSDTVQQIISGLDDKYNGEIPYEPEVDADYAGPTFSDPITEIPEDILQPIEVEEEASEDEAAEEG
ncbi:MAG: flagellar motor protein MotB [Bacteroides sp.]|nr:flagellar motor protein MotB [Eubacterium sp.]MCM1419467.1 flagellar motor protein MotB [Roseburia sp.]MCM1463327.1 flagellar motor protein MotB [Bacteroides sp.]